MIKKLKIVLLSLSMLCFIPMNTYAATLNVVGGELMGASGVLVGGLLYDVEFKDGTCAALYGGCNSPDDFIFNTYGSSRIASQALFDQVLIDSALGAFHTRPELINGIENTMQGLILNPNTRGYFENTVELSYATIFGINDNGWTGGVGDSFASINENMLGDGYRVWAVWTPHTVPEPKLFVLLACGLVGLAVFARRLKKREERLTF